MMTSAQVVETSVTVTDNSPFQDYPHPDDHTTQSFSFYVRWRAVSCLQNSFLSGRFEKDSLGLKLDILSSKTVVEELFF